MSFLPYDQNLNINDQISQLHQQNLQLQKVINQYLEQIDNLKKTNQQHQKEIESLLKFNQRLLTIIEEEVNNNHNKNKQKSLQPISEVTEVDSQVLDQMMQSLKKTKKKITARSQRGMPYKSQIQIKHDNTLLNNNSNTQSLHNYDTKNDYHMGSLLHHYIPQQKDLQRSQRYVPKVQRDLSQFGNKSSFSKKRQKKILAITKSNFNLSNNLVANNNNNLSMNYNSRNDITIQSQNHQFGSRKQLIEHQLSMQELQRASTDARPSAVMNHFNNQHMQQFYLNNEKNPNNYHLQQQNLKNLKYNPYSQFEKQITQKMQYEIQEVRKVSEINNTFLQQKITQLQRLSKEITYNPQQKFSQLQSKFKLSPHLANSIKKAMLNKNFK